uniref:Uncharacterized protein n=1 Tax=Rhizochromulina marina TaxID=1034831 RepID=A0A7S2STX8_9STRA
MKEVLLRGAALLAHRTEDLFGAAMNLLHHSDPALSAVLVTASTLATLASLPTEPSRRGSLEFPGEALQVASSASRAANGLLLAIKSSISLATPLGATAGDLACLEAIEDFCSLIIRGVAGHDEECFPNGRCAGMPLASLRDGREEARDLLHTAIHGLSLARSIHKTLDSLQLGAGEMRGPTEEPQRCRTENALRLLLVLPFEYFSTTLEDKLLPAILSLAYVPTPRSASTDPRWHEVVLEYLCPSWLGTYLERKGPGAAGFVCRQEEQYQARQNCASETGPGGDAVPALLESKESMKPEPRAGSTEIETIATLNSRAWKSKPTTKSAGPKDGLLLSGNQGLIDNGGPLFLFSPHELDAAAIALSTATARRPLP